MKKLLALLFAAAALALSAAAAPSGLVLLKTASPTLAVHDAILQALPKAGFSVSDDRDMNGPFTKQFGSTSFDIYHTITVYDIPTVHAVLPAAPRIGAFVPYTVIIAKTKGAGETIFGFVKADTIAATLAISDKKVIAALKKSEQALEKALRGIDKSVKTASVSYKPALQSDPERFFEVRYNLAAGEDASSKKEDIQAELESALDVAGFKIANITKLNDEFGKIKLDDAGYEFYETYSVCKLAAINAASKVRPEVGAFAPCSVFFYKKKGENAIVMGMPTTKNWTSVTAIDDPEVIKTLKSAESVVTESLKSITE